MENPHPSNRYGDFDHTRLSCRCLFAGFTSLQHYWYQIEDSKFILRDEKIPNLFFDVRNDSDALFAHFGVTLQGVEDLQLMKNAMRTTTRSRTYLNGLVKCVQDYMLYDNDRTSWKLTKEKGMRLVKRLNRVVRSRFSISARSPTILFRTVLVIFGNLTSLRYGTGFRCKTNSWRTLVIEETKKARRGSQESELYKPNTAQNRTLAPWSEDRNRTLVWDYGPPPRDYFDDEYFNDDCADDG